MFYNTVNLEGTELKTARRRATRQEDIILAFFQTWPYAHFSPYEVWNVFKDDMLITSVRRAITDLKNEGKLEKTDIKVPGPYGMPNYAYRVKGK